MRSILGSPYFGKLPYMRQTELYYIGDCIGEYDGVFEGNTWSLDCGSYMARLGSSFFGGRLGFRICVLGNVLLKLFSFPSVLSANLESENVTNTTLLTLYAQTLFLIHGPYVTHTWL